jgi:hypothetical protein
MEPLHGVASTTLRSLLHQQPTSPGKVMFAWRVAAGPALGRAGAAELATGGTLRVRARDEAWRRELQRARPVILERLRHLLGDDTVRKIVII